MKLFLYSILIISLISSCKSVNKLVENGQYDEAIVVATRKLAGKKKKKTDHIIALEKAFAKITANNMNYIKSLDANNNPLLWSKVMDVAYKIEARQNKLRPFLPLISKDGYEANFKFVNTRILINNTKDNAAAYHYNLAKKWLSDAEYLNDKKLAQKAFYEFEKSNDFRPGYKDSNHLQSLSREFGIVNVLVQFKLNEYNGIVEEVLWNEWSKLSRKELDTYWKRFHMDEDSLIQYDYISFLDLKTLNVSPEKEIISHHRDIKKIVDGWVYMKNKNGEIRTDSLGNKLKRDVYRNINARVTEIVREKKAYLSLNITTIDTKTNRTESNKILYSESNFTDYALRFIGDKRALCNHDINRIKDFTLPFPDDTEMIITAGFNIENKLLHHLKKAIT